MGEPSIAQAIDFLFKDAYASLEQVQEHADEIESFSDSIVSCHWAIANLERIHRIYSQNPYSTLAQDAFSLRSNLERFIGSCHALMRMVHLGSTTSEAGCWIGGGRAAVKKRHVQGLQEEFWDHQRILSLVLANAVYMTTLDLQKENAVPNPELDAILRQSQKRHTVYEKTEKPGQEHKSQKPAETHAEQLEFSVCLRKYFDYIEKHAKKQVDLQRRMSAPVPVQSTALVRYSNHSSNSLHSLHEQQRPDMLSRRKSLTYGNSMEGHSHNEIYTRPRRNSTASRASAADVRSRNNSISSIQSYQTAALSSAQPSPVLSPSPALDRSEIQRDSFSSQPAGQQSTDDVINRAWSDITHAMQTMSVLEARAYIEGRLAGLEPEVMIVIREAMNACNSPKLTASFANHSLPNLTTTTSTSNRPAQSVTRRGSRPRSLGPVPAPEATRSTPTIRMVPPPAPPERAYSDPMHTGSIKKRNLIRPKSQKRLSGVRNDHARQLSTIVERPLTARSGAESIKSRKSIFSMKKEKLPPMPEKPVVPSIERKTSGGSNFSSDGSTLRGSTPEKSRVLDLEEVPEEPGPLPKFRSNRRMPSKNTLASKPLPMTPGDLLQPDVGTSPASSVKSRLSRFLNPLSKRSGASLHSTVSTPSLASGMKSRETLGQISNASLECLRKGGMNGSRSTLLVAYQEGPDQPFQVWLNALPYIEGRASAKV